LILFKPKSLIMVLSLLNGAAPQATHGLMRLSLAGPPDVSADSPNMIPGIAPHRSDLSLFALKPHNLGSETGVAFKFLRDGMPASQVIAMYQLGGTLDPSHPSNGQLEVFHVISRTNQPTNPQDRAASTSSSTT
jgi:hypothetical protein